MLDEEILLMFARWPEIFPLYEAAEAEILAAFPETRRKISKTQVSFYNKHLYAALWPPARKFPGQPRLYLGLTFGLGYQLQHPRIAVSVEPYPNRWTHHLLLTAAEQLDAQLFGWLQEAYDFSLSKSRR